MDSRLKTETRNHKTLRRKHGGKLLVIGLGNVLGVCVFCFFVFCICLFVFNLTAETQARKTRISWTTSN